MENQAHSHAVTAPPEAADGADGKLKRGGMVADDKRDRKRPVEIDGALVAERRAELAAFAQAGPGLAGIGLDDRRTKESRLVATRAGAPTWRASASASFASETASGASPIAM